MLLSDLANSSACAVCDAGILSLNVETDRAIFSASFITDYSYWVLDGDQDLPLSVSGCGKVKSYVRRTFSAASRRRKVIRVAAELLFDVAEWQL